MPALGAQPLLAARALVAGFTFTGPCGRRTLTSVVAITELGTPETKSSKGTFLLAPVSHVSSCTVTLSSHMVTLASMVARTILATVLAKCPRWAGLGTHCSRPAWRAGTLAGDVVAGAPILAGAP